MVGAALADQRATSTQLRAALGACTEFNPVYRRLVKMALEELQLIEQQIGPIGPGDCKSAPPASGCSPAAGRSPRSRGGFGATDHCRGGATAATFTSAKNLSSSGACPGEEQSAGVNSSPRSPKGNRNMRRLLNQAANAAAKRKGSIFEIVYRRLVPRPGHNKTTGAIAHRICHLIWMILHKGVHYEEPGAAASEPSKRVRTVRMIRTRAWLPSRTSWGSDMSNAIFDSD
jgi:hypothetical protein